MAHQSTTTTTPKDLESLLCKETAEPAALPLSLLKEITNDFSEEQIIGTGGFSVVYKGKLENRNVAVKKLTTYDNEKEYQEEVGCLMTAKHKNVVRFLGYCADTQGNMVWHEGKFIMADVQQRLLCFEYLTKGSLHKYIAEATSGLQWRDRYHILKGICQGLHYLHQNHILHLDLKPGNILLDGNLVAKLADFGLSRRFDEIQSRVITQNIGGTPGYFAPEVFNKEITYQLDIYSLGVLIIEILTGKKGYHTVHKVVKSWSKRLEESKIELEQVRVCAQIGIECTDRDPAKRPNTQHIISRLDETESMDRYIETGVSTSHQNNPDILIGTMHVLWLSYQQLNPNVKRCIEYCSIFPKGYKLRRDMLVRLWIAQGFVKTSYETEDMEDIASGYIQKFVSSSLLQPIGTSSDTDCFTVHDVLHGMLERVVRNFFRIENGSSQQGEGWRGDIPRDIQHLFIQSYDGKLITEKILGLESLRTLIVYVVGKDTVIEENVTASVCNRLRRLRVLAVGFSQEHDPIMKLKEFSVPESIGQLKHLRYFSFRTKNSCRIRLPSTLNNLEHIQLLDFGEGRILEFAFAELVSVQHIFCWPCVKLPYIGRLSSLQTLPGFEVSDDQGCELQQLRDLNKLRGKLRIRGLENVKTRSQALEANLASKRLTGLTLEWRQGCDTGCIQTEGEESVLEGLCPPVGLQVLELLYIVGPRYPDWMVSMHTGGLKHLQELRITGCSWDALPDNMEHLTSLKKLRIHSCNNIRSLPSLPQSLETFILIRGNVEFRNSCQSIGHPNCQKLEHVRDKRYYR